MWTGAGGDGRAEPIRIEGGRLAHLYQRYADDAVRLPYLITGDHRTRRKVGGSG
jgi:hypothetical protein